MACRFPGGLETPAQFWEFLLAGRDAISEIAADRWEPHTRARPGNAAALRGTTRRGGFLTDPAGFDADFFGITPREAELVDPQQRIVLEVTWEALEHAGVPPYALAGTNTGVFMGVGSDDYGRQMLEDLPRIEAWTGIGASCCAVANRVSYLLDLHGPSFTADAACASSLVAIHLAAASLRARECEVAIAGGVNIIAGPGLTLVLEAASAISPDGQSRPFDAEANGYVRGEGAGVIVLKRMADAVRDGDRLLAVIRGSAVSHDGRTNGIMAPNGAAQEDVARRALAQAGVCASSVDYVEAHGTGTRAGDPVEVAALSAVFGTARPPGDPCLIGSVKGNIGHLEAAAGVAGVIKAVLALTHQEIPPQTGFSEPNPAIGWDQSGLRVVVAPTGWPRTERPRRAGVSSFGYGGTVGHLILEQAPDADLVLPAAAEGAEPPPPVAALPSPHIFPLSGASQPAVRDYAGRLADLMGREGTSPSLLDLRHTLWRRRSHLPARAAVVAADAACLRYELRKLASGQPSTGVTTGTALPGAPAPAVWVFSGHGSQWEGMGRELLASEPAFAEVVAVVDPIFQEEIGFSPRQVLLDGKLGDVGQIQSMLFVMHTGLAAVWRDLGLRPAAIIGHSVGEVAAAVTAGVFSLADGARLICRRSSLLRRVAGAGAMAMVHLPFQTVRDELASDGDVEAAIESSSDSTVVAGTPEGIGAYREQCAREGVSVRAVASDVAFHTRQMEPLLADLQAALADLEPAAPGIPVYSTALADPRANPPRGGEYWAANLRNPVRLASAVKAAAEDGHRIFLELSPHPVVAHSISDTVAGLDVGDSYATGSLRRNQPERAMMQAALAGLYCHGCEVDVARLGAGGSLISLPRTAWRHRRYWREPEQSGSWDGGLHDLATATLLGSPVELADPASPRVWRTRLEYESRPYPGSHAVQGVEIVPAAVILNTFCAATGQRGLADVRLHAPLPVTSAREVQVLSQDGAVRLASRPAGDGGRYDTPWQLHATAAVAGPDLPGVAFDLEAARARCGRRRTHENVLERLRASGISGNGLPWQVEELLAAGHELVAQVRIDGSGDDSDVRWARLLDALTSLVPMMSEGDPDLRLVVGFRQVSLGGSLPATPLIYIRDTGDAGTDAIVMNDAGEVLGAVEGMRFQPLDGHPGAVVSPRRFVHRVEWRRLPDNPPQRTLRSVTLVGGDPAVRDAVARRAKEELVSCEYVPAVGPDLATLLDSGQLDDRDAILVLGSNRPDGGAAAGPVLLAEAAEKNAWTLTQAAQMLAARSAGRPPLMWCVTTGVREAAHDACLPQSPLWGLGRIINGEHPDFWGGVVDLDPLALDVGATALFAALRARREQDLLAPRGTAIEAARLVPIGGEPARQALRCRADATYLITGGLGALGLDTARWLASRGARRLILAGRTPMLPRSQWGQGNDGPGLAAVRRIEAVRELEAQGVTVRVVSLDIADADAATASLDADTLGLPPIRGVVHAAGVLDNCLLANLTLESLRKVMRPKVAGALVLDKIFPPGSIDFLAFFSSLGQFLGLAGQASYASANAFLDGLARARRHTGHDDTISLSWTSWRGVGMGVNEVVAQELEELGVGDISPADAFLAWEYASRHRDEHVCVVPVLARGRKAAPLPVLRELDFARTGEGAHGSSASPAVFTGLAPEQLRAALAGEVSSQVGAEMRMSLEDLDVRIPLNSLGLDSVMTAAIRRRLEAHFALRLPASLLWNHPTIAAVADYLADRLVPASPEESMRHADRSQVGT